MTRQTDLIWEISEEVNTSAPDSPINSPKNRLQIQEILGALANNKLRRRLVFTLAAMGILLPTWDIVSDNLTPNKPNNSDGIFLNISSDPENYRTLPDGSRVNSTSLINFEYGYQFVTWSPMIVLSFLLLMSELLDTQNVALKIKKFIQKLRETTINESNKDELNEIIDLIELHITEGFRHASQSDIAHVKNQIFSLIQFASSQEAADINKIVDQLLKSTRSSFNRVLVGMFLLTTVIAFCTDQSSNTGIKPFEILRGLFPRNVSNFISPGNIKITVESIYNYLIGGELPELLPNQVAGDAVYPNGDKYMEGVLDFEGSSGTIEAISNITPSGYYAYGSLGNIQGTTSQELISSFSIENHEIFESYYSVQHPEYQALRINDLELSVESPYINGAYYPFSFLLTRLPEGEFNYPFGINDLTIYGKNEQGEIYDLQLGIDYEILTNPEGYSIVHFLNNSFGLKYYASYTNYRVQTVGRLAELGSYDYQNISNAYRENLFTSLRTVYPDGIIDITDSDALGIDFLKLDGDLLEKIIGELLDEAYYDINLSPDIPSNVPAFISALNSSELIELYCLNAAQASQILSEILRSSEFKLKINGRIIDIPQEPDRRMYIGVGFSITTDERQRQATLFNSRRHAFTVVSTNIDLARTYHYIDYTPNRVSPFPSDNTMRLFNVSERNQQDVPGIGSVGDSEEIYLSGDGLKMPEKLLTLPTSLIAIYLAYLILKKPRQALQQKRVENFTQRFTTARDRALLMYINNIVACKLYSGNSSKVSANIKKVEAIEDVFRSFLLNITVYRAYNEATISQTIKEVLDLQNFMPDSDRLEITVIATGEKYVYTHKQIRIMIHQLINSITNLEM